jgi:hypothetical protein
VLYIYAFLDFFYKRMHSTAVHVFNRNMISDTSGYQYTFTYIMHVHAYATQSPLFLLKVSTFCLIV